MPGILDKFKSMFDNQTGVTPGIYHYRRELEDKLMRLHLRVDPDGSGLLTVNASGVLHLNATAIFLMKLILDGKTKEQSIATVRKVYKAKPKQIEDDYDKIIEIINQLETTEDACPMMNLNVATTKPFGKKILAPYRADLALTYACNNKCQHCYVAWPAWPKDDLTGVWQLISPAESPRRL